MHPTKRINFADHVERKQASANIIEMPGGAEVRILPPELWDDRVTVALAEGRQSDALQLILGDDHQAFVDGGGTWRLFNSILAELQGAEVGESGASPTS